MKGTVEEIPAGWSQLYLLSAGHGIVDGMMAWGDRMLKFTGKPRANMRLSHGFRRYRWSFRYGDEILGSIGFWTDNGGYYHYATGSNETYEEVLPKVKAYHESLKIPFKHWQPPDLAPALSKIIAKRCCLPILPRKRSRNHEERKVRAGFR